MAVARERPIQWIDFVQADIDDLPVRCLSKGDGPPSP